MSSTDPKALPKSLFKRVGDWFAYKDKDEWSKEMKGSLSLAASIIATITFSLALNPPGGVFQASHSDNFRCSNHNGLRLCPGEAVLATIKHDVYYAFLVCNTICFVASLSVCLLLVSGIPLYHRFQIWLLSIGMCITIVTLALTYMFAAFMVTPDFMWGTAADNIGGVLIAFAGLVAVVLFMLTIRLCVRGVQKYCNKQSPCSNENGATSASRL